MIPWINELAARVWPASLTLAGQAAALVVVLLIAERVFRRRLPSAWAAALWVLVLVRLVLPPGLQSPTSVSFWLGPWLAAPVRVTAPTPVAPLARVEQVSVAPPKLASASVALALAPSPRLSRSGWLLLGWGVGSLICLGWMVRKNQEVRRLVGLSTEASAEGNAELRRVAAEVGLRRLPRLRLTSQDHSPAVWGWFQPVILLPQALADSLSSAGLRDVLAHELIHLRRGDLWLNLPQAFLQAIWWWNPVVWLATARIRMWREQAVDDAVMALSREEDASYPQTLVEVARFCAARPTVSLGFVGILESRRSVRYRVLRLVNAPPARRTRLGWSGWMVVLLVAILALPMAFARRVEVGAAVGSVSEGKDPLQRPLEIQVSSDGFEVGGQQLGPEELARRLSQEKSINPERSVTLSADTEDAWRHVIKALDLVKRAGFTNVKAFTRRKPAVRYEGSGPDVTAFLEARAAEPGAVKIRSPQIESTRTLPGTSTSESSEWRQWSPEAVENALAVGRPVLVLVTAKWDVSGRSYRRGLLESPEVRDRLHDLKALQLEADWTKPNAAIEALLKRFNRSGVPLILWYRSGDSDPVVLDDGGGVASVLAALAPNENSLVPRALIEVESQGAEVRYRFQSSDVSLDELKRRLTDLGKTAPDTTLRIRLYGGSRPEQVSDVLEWSKLAGLSRVDLATSALPLARVTPPHVSKAPLRIEVGALPSLYQIGGERITRDQLVRRLEQERTDNPQRSIVVVGSSEAGWKELVGIHELCRKVGFSSVSLDRSGPDRESRLALLHEFGLTWTELEVWARENEISLEASAATLRGHLLKNPPRRLETLKEWDSSPPRWVTVKMIETSVEGLELPLRDIQVESSGGARVASTGDPTLPWPSTVEGGLHFSGAVSMNGLIELERWKAIQKDIESRPGTRTRVTSTSHLVGRQDWGLSPVDVSANDFQRPGVPSDLLALQSTVRSNGVAFKATVRPNNWSEMNPPLPENPLQELRRELFLRDDQAWVVAILPEPPAGKGSPAGRKVARPAKLIVLTTQTNEP